MQRLIPFSEKYLDVLLYEDANVVSKLRVAIKLLLEDIDTTNAVRAATLALTHSPNQNEALAILMRDYPALMEHEWFQDIAAAAHEVGIAHFTRVAKIKSLVAEPDP